MSRLFNVLYFVPLVTIVAGPTYAGDSFDATIDTAWMSSRAMLGQNDPAFARQLTESLKPVPFFGPRSSPFSPESDAETFSLQWPLILRAYVEQTGDTEALEKHGRSNLDTFFNYFKKLENTSGMLTAKEAQRRLVHWPESLRAGFDYDNAAYAANAPLNAYYFGALQAGATLADWSGRSGDALRARAEQVRSAFHELLIDSATGLVRDAPESSHTSMHANALAGAFGLIPESSIPAVSDYLETGFEQTHAYLQPYIIEALYRMNRTESALALSDAYASQSHSIDTGFLFRRYAMGAHSIEPGLRHIAVEPQLPATYDKAERFTIAAADRRATIQFKPGIGIRLTVSPETRVSIINHAKIPVMTQAAISHRHDPLDEQHRERLEALGWKKHAGTGRAVWVDVDEQMLRVVEDGALIYQARCATAEKGVGSIMNSLQTPLGWHSVAGKVGNDAPWGQVFRARQPTREIWQPGEDTVEDLVLTRVILLTGEEPGKNKGGNVDSYARNIYIHGTNDEARIGMPSSHGCVRLRNDDVIDLFRIVEPGTPVLISAEGHMGETE